MAGREGLWLAQANRPAAPSQATRVGESGLAVRFQLRGTQPDPAAETNGSTNGKAHGAVCLKPHSGLLDRLQEAAKAASTRHKLAFQTDSHSKNA